MNSRLRPCGSAAAGSRTVTWKVAPWPRPGLSARMMPPISSASFLLMASPRPVPPYLRVVLASAWLKLWKSLARPASERPMPVSRTLMCLSLIHI